MDTNDRGEEYFYAKRVYGQKPMSDSFTSVFDLERSIEAKLKTHISNSL